MVQKRKKEKENTKSNLISNENRFQKCKILLVHCTYCKTAYIKPFTQKDIVHMCGAKKEAKTLLRLRLFEVAFESLIEFTEGPCLMQLLVLGKICICPNSH